MSSVIERTAESPVSQGSRATELLAKHLCYIETYYSQRSQRSQRPQPATVNRGQLRNSFATT